MAVTTVHPRSATAADNGVSTAVINALVATPGSNLVAISSASNRCTAPGGQAVAWTKNRIVIRTAKSDKQTIDAVAAALVALGIPGKAIAAERITVTDVVGATAPPQLVAVTLSEVDPLRIADLARKLRSAGVLASPDFVLSPSPGAIGVWPFGFPTPATTLPTPRSAAAAMPGAGARVFLYDTGLPKATQAQIPSTTRLLESRDAERVDAREPVGIADFYYSGHSVAIGGILRTMVPGATVYAGRITNDQGVATDFSAAKEMARTLFIAKSANRWPDVVVTPFGSPGCDLNIARPGDELVPLGLQAVAAFVQQSGKTIIVASAGNRATSRKFYPAAFPGVVAVGALDASRDPDGNPWTSRSRTAPVAAYSNFGTWVDAWAPGSRLNTNHLTGYRFEANGPLLNGIATVSGTSFSAPYVAAEIVELMRRHGISATAAWTKLQLRAPRCKAAVGGGAALALNTINAPADQPPLNTTILC